MWQAFFSWTPKSLQMVTAAMKLRLLLLGRNTMTILDSILNSRDIILLTKFHLVKAMVFPVVMYGCESWTIKKADSWRIDAFELWFWRRLLRVLWTARRSSQSVLKEINPEYSPEGLMLKLKFQYFRPPGVKNWLIGKDPDSGKDWRQEEKGMTEWDGWMASLTQWIWIWTSSRRWWRTGKPGVLQSMGLHCWTTTTIYEGWPVWKGSIK